MFDDIEEEDILKTMGKNELKLLELFQKFKKETLFSSHLEEFITVDDLDPSFKNFIIFDDCVTERDQRLIEDFFHKRKKEKCIYYLSVSLTIQNLLV